MYKTSWDAFSSNKKKTKVSSACGSEQVQANKQDGNKRKKPKTDTRPGPCSTSERENDVPVTKFSIVQYFTVVVVE